MIGNIFPGFVYRLVYLGITNLCANCQTIPWCHCSGKIISVVQKKNYKIESITTLFTQIEKNFI
jgi:hypothetical protein